MKIVRFLLPLIFVNLLSATPEKSDTAKKQVVKVVGWRSWKAQAVGLTVEQFIAQRKARQAHSQSNPMQVVTG